MVIGKVTSKDHIPRLEGKALLLAVHHAIRSHAAIGRKLLFLVDNMPLCLGAGKGSSSSRNLKAVLRETAAIALVTGCRIIVRWFSTTVNLADGPSRGRRPGGGSWGPNCSDSTPLISSVQHSGAKGHHDVNEL